MFSWHVQHVAIGIFQWISHLYPCPAKHRCISKHHGGLLELSPCVARSGPPGLDGSSNAPSSVNSEPSHAPVCESQRPINLLGYSPSSESLTSAGVSPHALMTWINETLHTSNQFTALWLVVAALALTMELCAGLVRGLRWCCRGNASDFCSVVWRRFLPDKPEVRGHAFADSLSFMPAPTFVHETLPPRMLPRFL